MELLVDLLHRIPPWPLAICLLTAFAGLMRGLAVLVRWSARVSSQGPKPCSELLYEVPGPSRKRPVDGVGFQTTQLKGEEA